MQVLQTIPRRTSPATPGQTSQSVQHSPTGGYQSKVSSMISRNLFKKVYRGKLRTKYCSIHLRRRPPHPGDSGSRFTADHDQLRPPDVLGDVHSSPPPFITEHRSHPFSHGKKRNAHSNSECKRKINNVLILNNFEEKKSSRL